MIIYLTINALKIKELMCQFDETARLAMVASTAVCREYDKLNLQLGVAKPVLSQTLQ
jgi:hypothetical protein